MARPINVLGFDWDDGNRQHCGKHGLSTSEIEEVFRRSIIVLPDAGHSQSEDRLKAIGRKEDRGCVFVVFTIRIRAGQRTIRPISARYMHQE